MKRIVYVIGGILLVLLFVGMVNADDGATMLKGKVISYDEIILGDRGNQIKTYDISGSTPLVVPRDYENHDAIVSGDVDGDGRDEYIIGDASDDDIHIYFSNPSFFWEELNHFDVDFERYDDLAVGDINGDGRAEIVLGDASDPGGKGIRVFDMYGNELAYYEINGGFERSDRVACGDIDGDGIDEIIHGDNTDGYIHIFKYDGSTYLSKIGSFSAAGDDPAGEGHFNGDDELACGDVDGNGIDEIIFGEGNNYHKIYFYDENGNLLYDPIPAHFDSVDELASGDVNRDGMDEIITGDANDGRIHIYDMYGNELKSFDVDYEPGDGLTSGDFNGDSLVLGVPDYKGEVTITDQVIAVVNAPPRDLSVIPDRGVFYAKYENEHGESSSMTVKAVTAVTTTGEPGLFSKFGGWLRLEDRISKKVTNRWEKTTGTTHQIEVGYGFSADARDYQVVVTTTYKVYEYPIIKPDELAGEKMLVMIPVQGPTPTTVPYDSPVHTYGFLLTYPSRNRDLLNYDKNNEIQGFAHGMPIGPDEQWTWIRMSESSFQEDKKTNSVTITSRNLFNALSNQIIGLGSGWNKKERTNEKITTHRVEFTEETSIHVYYAGGITEEDKYYQVTPVVYYDSEDGHLVLDYLVSNLGEYYAQMADVLGDIMGGNLFGFGQGFTDNSSIPSGLADRYQNQYGRSIFESDFFGGSTSSDNTILFTESRGMLPNETIEVPIQMKNARNIRNMDLILRYDPNVLSAVSAVTGSFTSSALFQSNIMDGEIRIAFVDTDGFSGNGSVAVITFKVIGNPGDYTTISLEASANDINDNNVVFEIINGVFTVEDNSIVLKGDVNGDGVISSIDALMALEMSVGKLDTNMVADMNDDGKVTSLDAAKILDTGVEDQADKTNYLLMGYSKGIKHDMLGGGIP